METADLGIVRLRVCSKCGQERPIMEFVKKSAQCRSCRLEKIREWKLRNADRVKAYGRRYYAKRSEHYQRYRVKNRSSIRKKRKETVENLDDSYIRELLRNKYPPEKITPELIEVKRELIQLQRKRNSSRTCQMKLKMA